MEQLQDGTILRKARHVQVVRIAEEAILFDERVGRYYGIKGAAEVVWEMLQDGDTLARLLARLDSEYELTEETKTHIRAAIQMLTEAGVLRHGDR